MERIGRYELSARLGRGGMGVVYRGFDTLLQRTVAVKLIGAQIDQPGMRERFFREARAAGQLSHKNIITVHDLGEENGQPFLAMEYLEGEDLQQRLNSPAKPSLTTRIDIAIQVCEGLEYAHARGVIHRDVKPANVFITGAGVVKILDFGLARLGASQLTNTGMVMGTINYMAPEQVRGEKADHRADIFSTGVLLYEMFSGHKAFEAESFAATLLKILQESPEPLDQADPTVPGELTQIVDRALAKRPEQRYQTMAELRADLEAIRRQFDSPTVFAPTAGPSDTTALVYDPAHDLTQSHVPSSHGAHSRVPRTGGSGSLPRAGGATGSEPPGSGARATSPTAPLDSEARRALSAAQGARRRSPLAIAGAALVAIAVISAGTLWLTKGADPVAPRGQSEPAAPPVSQANALPPAAPPPSPAAANSGGTQPSTPAASGTEGPTRSAAEPPATRPDPKPADTRKPSNAQTAEGRGQRLDPAAAAKPESPRTDPPKPATNPVPLPTLPVNTGTPVILPSSPIVTTAPPPPAPSAPAPPTAPAPEKPTSDKPATDKGATEKKGPAPEEAINDLVDRYRAALESREFSAVQRIWPGLSGRTADAIRSDFRNASRISVDISNRQIKIAGPASAVVTFVRRYTATLDGQDRPAITTATMSVRMTPAGWVIDDIKFSQPR